MADIVLRQGQGVDNQMKITYRDMGDGTYALIIAADIVPGGSIDVIDRAGRELGYVRTLQTYDGTAYVTPRLDASTFATTTISYAHHEIHSGSYYHCQYHQMVSDINDRSIITFRTANTASWVHMFARGSATAFSNWYIWEAPTVTDNTGAPLTVFNRNRNSIKF